MKKIIFSMALLAIASNSYAATKIVADASNRAVVAASTSGCSLLSEGVTLTLSQNVQAAYSCLSLIHI